MEQTLGKRISTHRKRLGLTQDQLAEQLGVTAQAVSKWENDLSCPDIATLPRLAAIFGITTDELLGSEPKDRVYQAEVVEEEEKDTHGFHLHKDNWEISFDSGRRWSLTCAILVLAVGIQLLMSKLLRADLTFWDILWPTSLLCFGIHGLFKGFRFLYTGAALFGLWFLLEKWQLLPIKLAGDLVLPVIIVIFGLSLLMDALKIPKGRAKPKFQVNGGNDRRNDFRKNGQTFTYSASFGDSTQQVVMPILAKGSISTSFGDFTIDLTGVEALAPDCCLEATCSFGDLDILVPRRFALDPATSTSFADISFQGHADPQPQGVIRLKASASFGDITVKYV